MCGRQSVFFCYYAERKFGRAVDVFLHCRFLSAVHTSSSLPLYLVWLRHFGPEGGGAANPISVRSVEPTTTHRQIYEYFSQHTIHNKSTDISQSVFIAYTNILFFL